MKKRIITFILLFAVIEASAQSLTVDEMIKECNCKTFDCVNDLLVQRKFHMYHTNDMSFELQYSFSGDNDILDRYSDAINTDNVAVELYNEKVMPNTPIAITFTTSSNTYFLELKKSYLTSGFQYKEEQNYEDPNKSGMYKGVKSTYKSAKYPEFVLIISTQYNKFEGKKWTDYEFRLEKHKVE
jgi:hypothetical protein